MSRALVAAPVPRDALSAPFTVRDVCAELVDPAPAPLAATAWSSPAQCARAAATARLAPSHHAATVALSLYGTGPALRLRALCELPARAELLLWFDEPLRALLRIPHLLPQHIRGGDSYVCSSCDARFEHPNPLKLHLYLQCRPFQTHDFWSRAHAELSEALTQKSVVDAPSLGALVPGPGALEALAAAWGRAAGAGGGHACVYCGKLYSRRYGLKIHIRTHTGYKPLRCAVCARAFGDPSNLNKHVRLHRATRPRPRTRLAAL